MRLENKTTRERSCQFRNKHDIHEILDPAAAAASHNLSLEHVRTEVVARRNGDEGFCWRGAGTGGEQEQEQNESTGEEGAEHSIASSVPLPDHPSSDRSARPSPSERTLPTLEHLTELPPHRAQAVQIPPINCIIQ